MPPKPKIFAIEPFAGKFANPDLNQYLKNE